ncbi:NlpC/P60 family protein [Microbispora cellulosiformans]|uniref:NlpC/P60 family protein n=1 Tax=Microbispora cellulosiformans TaxID=2614688 RepID=A0A5J5JRW6_9ACTN|nr:C40 family peptidase [Microbispora cellulosiformans]KAA9373880.1 NlpC/P60 family protein [Microbispora cellulosiformans]
MPLLRATGLVAGLGSSLALTFGAPAGADPKPSSKDVARARQQVQERARELGKASADLASAQARRDALDADAERLVEAYNGEIVRLERARAAYEQSERRAGQAAGEFDRLRSVVTTRVAQGYGRLRLAPSAAAMLGGWGDAGEFLRRASVLTQLGDEQDATLAEMDDARKIYEILREQAARAYAEQSHTADEVRQARDAAQRAVDEQLGQTQLIEREKEEISQRLDAARARVDELRRARNAARQKSRRQAPAARSSMAIPAWTARLASGRGGEAAQWALKQIGKPYVWAAAGPSGFDCSGLTMRAWQRAGVSLDHWTGTQWTSGRHVPLKELQSGDLLFYGRLSRSPGTIHHVGLYIGRGMMVHAPQTGDVVRISPIWRHDLVGATRPA